MYSRPSAGPSSMPVSSSCGPSGGPSGMQQVPVYTPAPTYSAGPTPTYSAGPSQSYYSAGAPSMYARPRQVPVYSSPQYEPIVCCDASGPSCVIL